MALNMMFGTYDGTERRNGLRARISGSADAPALRDLLVLAHEGIGRAHLPEAREVALLLHTLTTQLGAAGARPAPPLSAELAQRFGTLAEAWAAATDTPARIHAILDHYPVCRLSHEQFPKGQPGYLEGEPELTIRNLFTLAVKVGTDALKSDTGTDLFSTLIEQCAIIERTYHDRVRHVPHTKQTARAFRDGRFDPKRAAAALERIPTLAAGVMEDAVGALQQAGLLASPLAPAERARAASPTAIKRAAAALNEQAHAASARITSLLQANLRTGRLRGRHACVLPGSSKPSNRRAHCGRSWAMRSPQATAGSAGSRLAGQRCPALQHRAVAARVRAGEPPDPRGPRTTRACQ